MISSNIENFTDSKNNYDLLESLTEFDDDSIHLVINYSLKQSSIFNDNLFNFDIMIKDRFSKDKFEYLSLSKNKYSNLFNKINEIKNISELFALNVSKEYHNSVLLNNMKPCLFNESDILFILNYITTSEYFQFYFLTIKKTFSCYLTYFNGKYEIQIGKEEKKYIDIDELFLILKSSFKYENEFYTFPNISYNEEFYGIYKEINIFMDKFRTFNVLKNF